MANICYLYIVLPDFRFYLRVCLYKTNCALKDSAINVWMHYFNINTITWLNDQQRKWIKLLGNKFNFNKMRTSNWAHHDTPYDYDSMMHYGSRFFSKNRGLTIQTKNSRDQNRIGSRSGFSRIDIQQINKMYCNGESGGGSGGKCSPEGHCLKENRIPPPWLAQLEWGSQDFLHSNSFHNNNSFLKEMIPFLTNKLNEKAYLKLYFTVKVLYSA